MTLPTYYGQVTFYAKGADSVMQQRVSRSEWLEEEVASLAREGLRTLVLASRQLSPSQLERFRAALAAARLGQHGAPASAVAAVWEDLMRQEGMTLLAVTAVEDKLQSNVRTRVTHSRHTRGTRDMHEAAAPTAAPTCCRLQSHVLQAAAPICFVLQAVCARRARDATAVLTMALLTIGARDARDPARGQRARVDADRGQARDRDGHCAQCLARATTTALLPR